MSKDRENTQNNEELIIVNNTDLVPEGPIQMDDIIEGKKKENDIQKAETMLVDVNLVKNNSNVSFQSKSLYFKFWNINNKFNF